MLKNISNKFVLYALPLIASVVVKLIVLTMKIEFVDYERYREINKRGGGIILSFWHGRLLLIPYSYLGNNLTALISNHRDGELVSRFVKKFKVGSVRGSTTRGSLAGVKGLLKQAGRGGDLAITPDGPKGPGMKVQPGVIFLAKATGLPIIPMTYSASKKKSSRAGIPSSCHILSQGAYS